MKYELEPNILNQTECKDNFSCLNGDKNCLCEVEHMIDGKLLFIKSVNNKVCYYKTSFGYSFFCNCPARKEIYKRYRV
jgi:hypothetical protein